ncbi:hypothetical protein B0H10DRAFT_1768087, partial [Mycena sp. CBHHK59/15]
SQAAFSLYWGEGCCSNSAYTFEDKQTEARGSLAAILKAVMEAPHARTLIIYTSSQYAICPFCYWVGTNSTLGWPCTHSDVLSLATDWIQRHSAPVEFRWV